MFTIVAVQIRETKTEKKLTRYTARIVFIWLARISFHSQHTYTIKAFGNWFPTVYLYVCVIFAILLRSVERYFALSRWTKHSVAWKRAHQQQCFSIFNVCFWCRKKKNIYVELQVFISIRYIFFFWNFKRNKKRLFCINFVQSQKKVECSKLR